MSISAALASALKHFLVPTKCILNTSLSTCDLLLVHSAEVYNCYCVYVVQRSVVPYTFLYTVSYTLREIKIGMPTLGRGNVERYHISLRTMSVLDRNI